MNRFNKIGILGGGQLAKMLCDSAKKMKYETTILDPDKDACGQLSATHHLVENYDSEDGLKKLIQNSDVITYEFENVKVESVEYILKKSGNIPQGEKPLYLSQHRVREKNAVSKLGVKTVEYIEIKTKEQLTTDFLPGILKTCQGGYDGKNQWKIEKAEDIEKIELESGREYILEKMLNFDKEVSCLGVRGLNKDIAVFPPSENIHRDGILNLSIVPARISKEIEEKIIETTKQIIEGLDFVGPLAIEFFLKDDEIYFNEMAPRPHNSAHYTMDACNYSQFDLHLMSLTEEKLPKIELLTSAVMLNILGQDKEKIERLILEEKEKKDLDKKDSDEDKTVIHIYGKTEWKMNRKMGHINFCGSDLEKLIEKANKF